MIDDRGREQHAWLLNLVLSRGLYVASGSRQAGRGTGGCPKKG
jgi:hypothetical protein